MKTFIWVMTRVLVVALASFWLGFHLGQYTCKLNYQATTVFV